MDFLKSTKGGDPLGRQGGESLRGGGRLPPLNPPLIINSSFIFLALSWPNSNDYARDFKGFEF